MDFDRTWTQFAVDAEVDHFGTKRLVDAHNTKVAALEAKLEEPAHCNSGHETLPLKLWTCPTCHEELEAKLEAMEEWPEIKVSDGDVWLIFPNAALSIEGICKFGAPGPIVKRSLRKWKNEILDGQRETDQ